MRHNPIPKAIGELASRTLTRVSRPRSEKPMSKSMHEGERKVAVRNHRPRVPSSKSMRCHRTGADVVVIEHPGFDMGPVGAATVFRVRADVGIDAAL